MRIQSQWSVQQTSVLSCEIHFRMLRGGKVNLDWVLFEKASCRWITRKPADQWTADATVLSVTIFAPETKQVLETQRLCHSILLCFPVAWEAWHIEKQIASEGQVPSKEYTSSIITNELMNRLVTHSRFIPRGSTHWLREAWRCRRQSLLKMISLKNQDCHGIFAAESRW